MDDKKKVLIMSLAFTLLIMLISVSYAIFTYSAEGSTLNTIQLKGITFHYEEINKKGRGISITDANPVSSNESAKHGNKYFDFKITASTDYTLPLSYIVTAERNAGSDSMLGNYVDMYLTEINDGAETPTDIFSGDVLTFNQLSNYNKNPGGSEKVIYNGFVENENYEKNFRLRMWMDEGASFASTETIKYYCGDNEVSPNSKCPDNSAPSVKHEMSGTPNDKNFSITVNVFMADAGLRKGRTPSVAAGLYNVETDEMLYSWDELIENNFIKVTDGKLEYGEDRNGLKQLTGRLVIDYSVDTIGAYAFGNCDLTEVIIPDSVTKIENDAFEFNMHMTKVEIPETVTEIGNYAFWSCYMLSDYEIPPHITKINYESFAYTAKPEVVIPQGVTEIADYAFCGCGSTTKVTIPDSVTKIGNSAFQSCGLKDVVIPDSVTSLGSNIFKDNRSLFTVELPEHITSVPDNAFSGCRYLNDVVIPEGVTAIGMYAFEGCEALTNITLPSTLTTLGMAVFKNCVTLEKIDIPNGVTSIPNAAFEGDTKLTTVNIPDSVTSIGDRAFYNDKKLVNVAIPPYTTKIGQYAFYFCQEVKSLTLPNTVTSIGNYAFQRCEKMHTLTLPNNITTIPSRMCSGCYALTHVDIPNTVTSIGGSAFEGCKALDEIVIPNSVTTIGSSAFSGCTNANRIVISNNLKIIPYGTFMYTSNVTSVDIPASVEAIGDYSFQYSGITSATIGTTTGWKAADYKGATSYISMNSNDISNPATLATYLTSTYYNKYWWR